MSPRPYFHSKASGDGSTGRGGGGSSTLGRGPMSNQKMYDSQVILSLDKNNEFFIMKNRFGDHGKTTMNDALNLIGDMITRVVFDGSMDMFQETMKMKMVECIKDVISGNIIPEGEVE